MATVGVPPWTATAPPLTRILPAASRLTVMVLSRLSPNTVSTPVLGENVAVIAMVLVLTKIWPRRGCALAVNGSSACVSVEPTLVAARKTGLKTSYGRR